MIVCITGKFWIIDDKYMLLQNHTHFAIIIYNFMIAVYHSEYI